MSLLPKRVMLRCWFFSLPVLAIDFWTAIRKSFTKVRPIFLKRAQGIVIWRATHSYMSLRKHFVKVSKMHEIVHMINEVLWKPVDNFSRVDEDV